MGLIVPDPAPRSRFCKFKERIGPDISQNRSVDVGEADGARRSPRYAAQRVDAPSDRS
jgi:hypothetical protein